MHWLAWALLGFRFQETAMLGRGIAAEVNSAGITASLSPLPRGSAGSSVHGIELSVLAQWAFNQPFGVNPPLHTSLSCRPQRFKNRLEPHFKPCLGMSNSNYGKPYESDRYSAQRQAASDT
jgi:hypothetical protein